MNGIAKVQHYVPQFLLKNFGNGKKDQLHVFDKSNGKVFPTNAKNIAGESNFYNFVIEDTEITIEPSLSRLESKSKPIFRKILDQDHLRSITNDEKATICAFLAIQFTRTRAFKEQFRALPEMLGEKLRAWGETPEQQEAISEYIQIPDDNQLKIQMARMMSEAPKTFGPHFAAKHWLIIATSAKHPFMIGDNPLAMQNTNDFSPRGNIGLGVRGIEIYLPLSPTRALAMWCPSLTGELARAIQQLHELRRSAPMLIEENLKDPAYLEYLWAAVSSGNPLQYSQENVTNFNSLQVRFAERHVFSSRDDFELPKRMISDIPAIRKGPRPSMG